MSQAEHESLAAHLPENEAFYLNTNKQITSCTLQDEYAYTSAL